MDHIATEKIIIKTEWNEYCFPFQHVNEEVLNVQSKMFVEDFKSDIVFFSYHLHHVKVIQINVL